MFKQWLLAALLICGVLLPATAFARPWRDQKGNIINADFVKIEGGMIYLKPENKYAAPTPFPFYDFSEADQEFVRAILKKKGQEDRIPPRPKDDPNKPGQPGVAVPVTIVPNAAPTTTGIPDSAPANSNTTPAVPIAVTPTVPPTYVPPTNPVPSYSPPVTPSPMPSPMPPPMQNVRPGFPFGPQGVERAECLSCKKAIPVSSTVGQKCPHCGVIWTEEQNEYGQVTNTAPGHVGGDWKISRGAIKLTFLIGVFVIGGIAKLIHNNS